MKVVYVAGPYRGANAWEVEQNIRRAEAVALELWRMGAAAVCPHANSRFFNGTLPDDVFLKGDLELLSRCDGVVLVRGWEQSAGAVAEVRHASRLVKPTFRWPGRNLVRRWMLERWIRGQNATMVA